MPAITVRRGDSALVYALDDDGVTVTYARTEQRRGRRVEVVRVRRCSACGPQDADPVCHHVEVVRTFRLARLRLL
jgi:hypothetical protein